jgi:hypothetical protein
MEKIKNHHSANQTLHRAPAVELPLQPVQFAALRERGLFVTPAGESLREHGV